MAEHLRKDGRLPAPAIKGYTLAFEEEGDDNEISYMRAVRDHLGVPIHEFAPTTRPLAWFGERALEEQDFPGFPNAAMFADMREAMTAGGCRVVLNGEGGDEWLGGSRLYYADDLAGGEWRALGRSYRSGRREVWVERAVVLVSKVRALSSAAGAGQECCTQARVAVAFRALRWGLLALRRDAPDFRTAPLGESAEQQGSSTKRRAPKFGATFERCVWRLH